TGVLASSERRMRFAAYGLVVLGGAFKYYPLALIILALRERLRAFLIIAAFTLAAIALYVLAYHDELQRGLPLIPGGSYFASLFSSKNIPLGVPQVMPWLVPSALGAQASALFLSAALMVIAFTLAMMILRGTDLIETFGILDELTRIFL